MEKSFPLKHSILRHERMKDSYQLLCSDFEFEKAYTSLSKQAFIEKWNRLMLTRYANLEREKRWRRENQVQRLLCVYALEVPQAIKRIICEFLKPGPPPLPRLRRYTNAICDYCGDALAYVNLPCYTCGCVRSPAMTRYV